MNSSKTRPTPVPVSQALEHLQRWTTPTEHEKAQLRFSDAKKRFTEAARLALAGDKTAEQVAKEAYRALEAAPDQSRSADGVTSE